MLSQLQRTKYKKNGGNKYQVDCSFISNNPKNIHIENMIRNKNDISILTAFIDNPKIITKHKHIVIKIGKENKTIEKEYTIGIALNKEKLVGFIQFICLFDCFDDTNKTDLIPINGICNGEQKQENKKNVLIMPFFVDGSIKNYNWLKDKFIILKSLLQQAIMSIFIAYHKLGFLHGDLHLDNILMKRTTKNNLCYECDGIQKQIDTNGYKIAIMDFDSSWIGVDKKKCIEFYWLNIYNMLSRVSIDLTNHNSDKIGLDNNIKILLFITKQKDNKTDCINTLKLLNMIDDAEIQITKNPFDNLKYDPTVFG